MATSFDVYCDYVALKLHFMGCYDYFRYDGATKVKPSSLEKRSDKQYFGKLAKRKDYHDILLANFIEHDRTWIGDLVERESEEIYTRWKSRTESITYQYKNDLSKLTLEDFEVVNGQHPMLITKYLRKEISIESLTILDIIIEFNKYYARKIEEKYIYPDISRKIEKYRPFIILKIDLKKLKEITKDFYDDKVDNI